jgi:hypothetical protein
LVRFVRDRAAGLTEGMVDRDWVPYCRSKFTQDSRGEGVEHIFVPAANTDCGEVFELALILTSGRYCSEALKLVEAPIV